MHEQEIGPNEVLLLIEQGEGEVLEWKDSRILNNPFKLARSMAALANHKGGLILIGVKDDGTIEGMEYEKTHEEYVMNVAAENCNPPIRPQFRRVTIPDEGSIYVVKIVRNEGEVRHGVKTKDGWVYPMRVGSTVREISPLELSTKTAGVKVKPYTAEERGFLFITEKLVSYISRNRRWSIVKTMLLLVVVGVLLVAMSMLFLFGGMYGVPGFPLTYPWWVYILILVGLGGGVYLCLSVPAIAKETTCPACKAAFKYKKNRSEVLSKRRKSRSLEEWTVRNLYRCDACGHETEEVEYEENEIS